MDAVGISDATRKAGARTVGALVGALRFFDTTQREIEDLLLDREALKLGTLSRQEKASRGFLNPDGSDNTAAIAKAVADIDAAIAFVYHEAQSVTARPGYDRVIAGTKWEKGQTPTAEQLATFFGLRDTWSTSDKFPETLAEWGAALSLQSPTKATVLAELSRRTKDRAARVRAKYTNRLAELISLTAARIHSFDRAYRAGRLSSFRAAGIDSTVGGTIALLGPKIIALAPASPSATPPRFGKAEPLLIQLTASGGFRTIP